MVVFSFHHTDPNKTGECTWSVKDFTLCPTKTFEDIIGAPHRGVFTYDHSKANSSFYGELPSATAPEGYVFSGLYTADGTGNLEGQAFSFDSNEIDSVIKDGTWSLRLSNALETNQTATAKWEITVTFANGTTETFTAYTVLYTPMRTIGAVAESRRNSNVNNEFSTWITGANGVDHQQRSPLGEFKGDIHDSGYFKADPLYNGVPTSGGSSETSDDYIVTTDKTIYGKPGENETDDYSENAYVLQTATHGEDSSRAQSYLGLLMVDSSRYTNTNQIPNFKLGYDYLRAATGTPYAKFGDKDFAVKSNTEMYYDITGYIVNGTVTIQNKTSETLLSVGSVKITNTVDQTALLSSEFDLATASFMMMAPSSTVEPNVPDEPVIPEVPVEPEDSEDPEEPVESWFIKMINWIIDMFKKIIFTLKNILGF